MLQRLRSWRRHRILRNNAIDDGLWRATVDELPILTRLTAIELGRLRQLATLFLHQKTFVGTHGLVVDARKRVIVAAQACLPILNLSLDFYRGWYTVILYPGGFVAAREIEDEHGIVHSGLEALDGESADGGPVALAWDEAQPQRADAAHNVVIHEFAHKLDEYTGVPNGLPPLPATMSVQRWAAVMGDAFAALNAAIERHEELPIDEYAATDPAEFFAVMSELFFTAPATLTLHYAEVYEQLAAFYRQDPQRQ